MGHVESFIGLSQSILFFFFLFFNRVGFQNRNKLTQGRKMVGMMQGFLLLVAF